MSSRSRIRTALLSFLILPALLLATPFPAAAAGPAAAAAAPPASSSCSALPLERRDFPGNPTIDNRFLPMVPGMQFFLDGFVIADDGSRHPHRIETTVTDLTKVIDGVRSVVIFDRDIQDGRLIESELFFLAQDNDGKVWTLGEYPEEYEPGKPVQAPSTWISGVAGARAGIAMRAHPAVGSATYLQGLAPRVGFWDCGTVFKTGVHTCVPAGCYDNVVVIDEFAPLDPLGGHQLKFYASGVGSIKVAAAGGVDPETLTLTQASKLCPGEFARVRDQVLKQDSRGYRISRDVYGTTPPARRALRAQTCDT